MMPFRKKRTTTIMMTENTTSRKPMRKMPGASMPRKAPLSKPRSHHSEAAMNRVAPMTEPEMEPMPPSTTMSRIS